MSGRAIPVPTVVRFLRERNIDRWHTTIWGKPWYINEEGDLQEAGEWLADMMNEFADWLVAQGYADPRGVI